MCTAVQYNSGLVPTDRAWAASGTHKKLFGQQAAWYRREEIDLAPDDYSLTNHMIQAFRRGDWD